MARDEKGHGSAIQVPGNLLTDLRRNPLGIARRTPAFTWQLPRAIRFQTAYQVQVVSAPGDFTEHDHLIWDSGKVISSRTAHVRYSGPPLKPATCYRWRVRVWDEQDRPTAFSDPGSFVTGLWDGWRARWIWADAPLQENQHVFFRRQVALAGKPVRRVLAFVSADDYYKLYVNGRFAGQGPTPGYPEREYHYNTVDLTPYAAAGGSLTIAAHAYYQGLKNYVWVSGDGRRGFILELHIHYEDGTRQIVTTDESWRALVVPGYVGRHVIGMQTAFNEDIDARLIPTEWQAPEFADGRWPSAVIISDPDWKLHAQETEMLAVYDIAPEKVVTKGPGHYFFDFGKEVVGTVRIAFDGRDGETVELRLGEELDGPDTVRYEMRCNCLYQDFWTLRDGRQEIELYDYRGFRYGEIIGPPGVVDPGSIRAVVRHYPANREASSFECSDERLNALWELAKYTTIMGTQEVYMDCPTREKANYSLDTYLEMSAALYQTGEANLGRRMIELLLQSATDGKLRCLGPAGREHFFTEYTLYPILMAWRYYEYTADTDFLARNFSALQRVIEYFAVNFDRTDGMLQGTNDVLRDLVDWPENRRDGHEMLPVNIVVNAVYYRALTVMADAASVLGRESVAAEFAGRADRLRSTLNRLLWDERHRRYIDGLGDGDEPSRHSSLHANVFPLAMGLVPEERVPDVLAFIKTRGFNCNTFSAMFLFEALYDYEETDYAFQLLTAEGDNSPMHMVRQGATTTWEAWALEHKWNTSLFHPATAFTGYILASRVMGIRPLEPGYTTICIKPQLGPLTSATIRVPTILGHVDLACEEVPGTSFRMHVSIPSNARARVYVPRLGRDDVYVVWNGERCEGSGVGAWIVLDGVEPGDHEFVR